MPPSFQEFNFVYINAGLVRYLAGDWKEKYHFFGYYRRKDQYYHLQISIRVYIVIGILPSFQDFNFIYMLI